MTDEPAPSAVASWNVRVIFGSIVLAFALATIAYVTLYGKPDNSLHGSALAWSFALVIAILAGFGVGRLSDGVLTILLLLIFFILVVPR